MNHEALACQLVRALRGNKSQTALSRHLGYRCNVVYTWESGRRAPGATAFFKLALKAKLQLVSVLQGFLGREPGWLTVEQLESVDGVSALLRELQGGMTQVEIARRMGVNRVSVSRWLGGNAEPRLPELLRLIDVMSDRLVDFVALFSPPAALAEVSLKWAELQAQRRVAYGLPWSHAVLRVLELEEYQNLDGHQPGWVAKRLGLPIETERECIEALAAARVIVKRKGRWLVSRVLTVDTRSEPTAGRQLKLHWARAALDRLERLEPNKLDLFSYNLFAVSEQDLSRIRELHVAYYRELRSIVAESKPGQRVALVNLQLLRLDECSAGGEV